MQTDPRNKSSVTAPTQTRMALRIVDGFTVTFSVGVERFIGRYPRLDGISADGGLLTFHAIQG